MSEPSRVAVIGACGHVGLPLALVLCDAGFQVTGIDIDALAVEMVNGGKMPFGEDEGEAYLERACASGRMEMSTNIARLEGSDVVVIVPGTPIDDYLNPRLEPLAALIRSASPYLRAGQLIVLRSTVAPGTTDRVRDIIEAATGLRCGQDIGLVFAPERVLQGRAIAEIQNLPQLIGAFDEHSYELAERFFSRYVRAACIRLSPVEAEIGKLVTNMARYIRFAFANEVYLIAETWGANANRIIDAVNQDYPRADIARPGANVGGPCLYKDGYFLTERIAFPDLISTAFKINEGMTAQILTRIEAIRKRGKVAILGMTFKADVDDIRGSLSFKLRKQLAIALYDVTCVDPYLPEYDNLEALRGTDVAVLMTPHRAFSDLQRLGAAIENPDCMMIDIWGHWPAARYSSQNGLFRLGDYL